MEICLNGNFVSAPQAQVSVLDHGFMYGDGFYDVMRTYGGRILEWDLHEQRISKSADTMGIALPWSPDDIAAWVRQVIAANRFSDARVRITITRGQNAFDFWTSRNPTLVINGQPYAADPAVYANGLTAWTMPLQRLLPEIKTIGLTGAFLASRVARERHVDEVVFLGEGGMVREASIANIFCVRDGMLRTPATGIFPGLTRHRTIRLARDAGLDVLEADFPVAEFDGCDEVFLTNRLRELAPIVRICGKTVGDGKPGPITKKLMAAYREYAAAECGRS